MVETLQQVMELVELQILVVELVDQDQELLDLEEVV
jgi:hypothetical protein